MFRPVRKKQNEIDLEAVKKLLSSERRGVIAVIGDNGYPYAIPVNFVYVEEDSRIYFHGARSGHKVDSLKACDKVCFTVYGNETIKDEEWAPYMQSAVAFGRCHLVMDQERAICLVRRMASKYYPDSDLIEEEIAISGKAVQMFEIEIEHMSGKEVQER